MERFVIIKFNIEGIHNWLDCPIKEVDFLRHPHRHQFYFKIEKEVTHNDRDIEIIVFKRNVIKHLEKKFGNPLVFGSMSCEMIAEHLLNEFDCNMVEVLEDNENGGKIKI